MAAYRRVDDFRSPAGWLPVHRYQLRAQRSVSSMGSLYLYLLVYYKQSAVGKDNGNDELMHPLFNTAPQVFTCLLLANIHNIKLWWPTMRTTSCRCFADTVWPGDNWYGQTVHRPSLMLHATTITAALQINATINNSGFWQRSSK